MPPSLGARMTQGTAPLPAIVVVGRILDDGVEGRGDEIGELHFDDRTQPHQRHARGRAHKAGLGDGHVLDPPVAKFVRKAFGDLEGPAKITADVLAHHQHIQVAPHLLAQRLADGRDVGQFAITICRLLCIGKAKVVAGLSHYNRFALPKCDGRSAFCIATFMSQQTYTARRAT